MLASSSFARRAGLLAVFLSGLALSSLASAQPAAGKPATTPAATPAAAPAPAPTATPAAGTPVAAPAPAAGADDVPVNLRLRRLEQQVQALKERAWRSKARVGMLKEAVLGGGIGARASIQHVNKMGSSYRLVQLVYALDGTTIFSRTEESGSMHETKSFDILSGPITPGSHTLSVLAVYRGHGYGVFKYLSKYKFTVRSSHTFTASEGKGTTIKAIGYERGGATTPLEQRPAIDFQVSLSGG
jgi:hypothetical protein